MIIYLQEVLEERKLGFFISLSDVIIHSRNQ